MLCVHHACPAYKPLNHILVSEPIVTFSQVRQFSPQSPVLIKQINHLQGGAAALPGNTKLPTCHPTVTASDSREKLLHPHEKLKSDKMKRLYIYTKDKVAITIFASSFPWEQHDINIKLLLKMSNTQPS